MVYIANVLSHIKLKRFYQGIFSTRRLLKVSTGLVTRGYVKQPLTVNFLVTNKCNFFCHMCSYMPNKNIPNTPLSLEDIELFIQQLGQWQPVIHLGGGEPFMHKDILKIVAAVKSKGLKCLITTNGFLLDEDKINKLIDLGLDGILFSLYGPQDVHDAVTGVKNSFDKAVAHLDIFLKLRKDTRVLVSTIPLPENIDRLETLIEEARARGIDGVKIEHINFITQEEYRKSMSLRVEPFDFCPSSLIQSDYYDRIFSDRVLEFYKRIRRRYKDFVYFKPYLDEDQFKDWYTKLPLRSSKCFFITHSLFINYNGDIIPCQFLTGCVLGNIRQDSLKTVWSSDRLRDLRKYMQQVKPFVCRRCCKN